MKTSLSAERDAWEKRGFRYTDLLVCRRCQPLDSGVRHSRICLSELLPVAGGLLEVVAEDLIELDQVSSMSFEPTRKALMQLRARRFPEPFIGGIANQQVAKAEAVVTDDLRPLRTDQLLTDEAGEPRRHLLLLGCERLYRTAVKDLALDRTALEHPSLG